MFVVPPGLVINELDANTDGTDDREFIELYNADGADLSLDEFVLVFFNGNSPTDASYRTVDLSGTLSAGGYLVIGNSEVDNVSSFTFPSSQLQNGGDAVAVYLSDVVNFPNGSPPDGNGLVDALVYDADGDGFDDALRDALGESSHRDEHAGGLAENQSIQRLPNGSETFEAHAPTPGVANFANAEPIVVLASSTLTYNEDAAATPIDGSATLNDADGDADWEGATLVVDITGDNDLNDRISIPDNVVGAINTEDTDLRSATTVIGSLSASEGTVDGATSLTITFSALATNALVQEVIRAIHFENISDSPVVTNRNVSFTVTDRFGATNVDQRMIEVVASDDDPEVDLNGATAGLDNMASFQEDNGPVLIAAPATVIEPDATNIESMTITITNVLDGTSEGLSLNASAATAASVLNVTAYNPATGVLFMDGSFPAAVYESVLQGVLYDNLSDNPTEADRAITVIVNDAVASSAIVTSLISVTAVNDPPTTDLNGGAAGTNSTASFVEDVGAVLIAPMATVSEVDNADDIESLTITLTNIANGIDESLALDLAAQTAVTNASLTLNSYSSATGVLSVEGPATASIYETILRGVQYDNSSQGPIEGDRLIEVVVNDGPANSPINTSTVTVTGQNDDPIVDLNGAGLGNDNAVTFTENAGTVLLAAAGTVEDIDAAEQIVSMTVTITNLQDGSEELLDLNLAAQSAASAASISSNYDSGLGILSITGAAAPSTYQTILQGLVYDNVSDNPTEIDRSITVVVNDDPANSNTATTLMAVVAANDPPTSDLNGAGVGSDNTASFFENLAAVSIAPLGTVAETDNGDNIESMTITISNVSDGLSESLALDASATAALGALSLTPYNSVDGTLVISGVGAVSTYQTILRGVQYNNLSDEPNTTSRLIEVVLNDGEGDGPISTSTMTLVAGNDAPTLTATGDDPTTAEAFGPVSAFSGASASTIEGTQSFSSFVVTVSGVVDGSNEELFVDGKTFSLASDFGSTSSFLSSTASLSGTTTTISFFGGTVSPPDFEDIINAITYNNTSTTPTAGDRIVVVTTITDNGGDLGPGDVSTATPAQATSTVSLVGKDQDSRISFSSGPGGAIDYRQFQGDETTPLATSNTLEVMQFNVADLGTVDPLPTVITSLTVDVTSGNVADLRTLSLFDGTQLLGFTSTITGTSDVISLTTPITIASGTDANYSLRASFQSEVTDDIDYVLDISNATAQASGSSGFGGGDISATSPLQNLQVLASGLFFVQLDTTVLVSTDFMVTVEAQDDFGNVDRNFGFNVELVRSQGSGTLSGTTLLAPVEGRIVYDDLQYNVTGDFRLRAQSTAFNSAQSVLMTASDALTDVIEDPAFAYPIDIDYTAYQGTSFTTQADGLQVAQFIIREGGEFGDGDNKVTEIDGQCGNDPVCSDTQNGFRIRVTSGDENIRQLAMFVVEGVPGVPAGRIVGQYTNSPGDMDSTYVFNFDDDNGSFGDGNDFEIPDNGSAKLGIYVTFQEDVTDREPILIDVARVYVNATNQSLLANSNGSPEGDGANPDTEPDLVAGENLIEVTATMLAITDAPMNVQRESGFEFTVEAQDANGNLDLDESSAIGLSFSDGVGIEVPSVIPSLSSGTLTLGGIVLDSANLVDGMGVPVDITMTVSDEDGDLGSKPGNQTLASDSFSQLNVSDTFDPDVDLSAGLSPADNTGGVGIDTELVMTFSETVLPGTGRIVIVRQDVPISDEIPANSPQVSYNGNVVTITPTIVLEPIRDYYVFIENDAFQDPGGNNFQGIVSTTSWNFNTRLDDVEPTVTITRGDVTNGTADNTNDGSITFDLQFSEVIDDATFDLEDILVTMTDVTVGGSGTTTADNLGGDAILTRQGDDENYTLTLSQVAINALGTDGTIGITVGPDIQDLASNDMTVGGPVASADFTIDQTPAQALNVSINSTNGISTLADIGDQINLTIEFDDNLSADPVVVFNSGNDVVNSVVSIDPSLAPTYTASYVVDGLDTEGAISFAISFVDDAGNVGTPVSDVLGSGLGTSVVYDNTPPTVTIARFDPLDEYTAETEVVFEVVFNESVANVNIDDFVATGSAGGDVTGFFEAAANTRYEITVGSLLTDGTISLAFDGGQNITDLTGNPLDGINGVLSTQMYTYDTQAPQVLLSDDHPDAVVRDEDDVIITATFTELNPLAGPPTISIALAGVTDVPMSSTADPLIWTFDWDVPDSNVPSASVSIGGADLAGNTINAPSGKIDYEIDNTSPTVMIDLVAPSPGEIANTTATSVSFDLAFDDDLNGNTVDISDFAVDVTGTVGFTATAIGGTAPDLTFTVSGISGSGDLGITVAGAGIQDIAGNDLVAPVTSLTFGIDNEQPSLVITRNPVAIGTQDLTNQDAVSFDLAFDEAIDQSSFDINDINVITSGVSADPLMPSDLVPDGNDRDFTLSISNVDGDGSVAIEVLAAGILDVAGNSLSSNVTSAAFGIDNTPPTLDGAEDADPALSITLTFSEEVVLTTPAPGDFAVVDAISGLVAINGVDDDNIGDANLELEVADYTNSVGDLRVTFIPLTGVITDVAGNGLASNSAGVFIDRELQVQPLTSENATGVLGDDDDDVAMYRSVVDPSANQPVRITPNVDLSTISIYADEALTQLVLAESAVTIATGFEPTVAQLLPGIDWLDALDDHGVYTLYLTETTVRGDPSEGPARRYSVAFLDEVTFTPDEQAFSESNTTGTTISIEGHPVTGQELTIIGDGLTDIEYNNALSQSSARFVPLAAGTGIHDIDLKWENEMTGVSATFQDLRLFSVSESSPVFLDTQPTSLCEDAGNQVLLVNNMPTGIDVDGVDGAGNDFLRLEVYYIENGRVKTDIVGDAPGRYRPDGELSSRLLRYDRDGSAPPIVPGSPTFATDEWEFNPSAIDLLGVADREVDTLRFVFVATSDNGNTSFVNSEEDILIFPQPEISLSTVEMKGGNIEPYYCEDEDQIEIEANIFTFEGGVDSTGVITTGYRLLYSPTDPTFATFDEYNFTASGRLSNFWVPRDPNQNGDTDEDESGYYRIIYEAAPHTPARCTSTGFVDLEVVSLATEPAITTDLSGIGTQDMSGVYLLEFCEGETLPTITATGSSVTWLGANQTTVVQRGATLDILNDVFGGNEPAGGASVRLFMQDQNIFDQAGAVITDPNFDGCSSGLIEVNIRIRAIPPAPEATIAQAGDASFNEEDLSTSAGRSYLYEYCAGDLIAGIDLSQRGVNINNISDSRAHFSLIPEDLDFSNAVDFNSNFVDWSADIFGGALPSDTVIYIALVTNDGVFAGEGPNAFAGCTSETSRFELRISTAVVQDILTTEGSDFTTEYFTCFGDPITTIDIENGTYNWYTDDGATTAGQLTYSETADNFLLQAQDVTNNALLASSTAYQVSPGAGYSINEYNLEDEAGIFYYWVRQIDNASDDSNFPGCESTPTLISLTVFEEPLEPLFNGASVINENDDDVDFELFFCASDLDESVTFSATLNGFVDAAFSTDATDDGSSASQVTHDFVWYNSNDAGDQLAFTASGSVVTAVDLGLISSNDVERYIYVEQVENIVNDQDGNTIYNGCASDGVVIKFTIFREPDAPIADANAYYLCAGEPIDDLELLGDPNAFFTWVVEGSSTAFERQADASGVAIASMDDLGIGQNPVPDSTYTIKVVQQTDAAMGSTVPPISDDFVGCASDTTEIQIFVRSIPDPVSITSPQVCADGQLVEIRFSGDQRASSFFVYPTDQQVPSLREDTLGGNAEQLSFNLIGAEEGRDTTIYISQITDTDLNPNFLGCESALTAIPVFAKPILGDFGGNNGLINDPRACSEVVELEVEITNQGDDDFADYTFEWSANNEVRTEPTQAGGTSPLLGGEIYSITMNESFLSASLPVAVTITDKDGCVSEASRSIPIGLTPDPQFRISNITAGNNTTFSFDDFEITDDNQIQSFRFELTGNGSSFQVEERLQRPDILREHIEDGFLPGEYTGALTLISSSGCENFKMRSFKILGREEVPTTGLVHNFNGTDADGWISESLDGFGDRSEIWEAAAPSANNPNINRDANGQRSAVWITNADGNYFGENGALDFFVYSPSFDFSALEFPAVSFDYFQDLVGASDGVVFQWSIDDGATWENLGDFTEAEGATGSKWFDSEGIAGNPGIIESNPGQIGWAGSKADMGWQRAVHSLSVPDLEDMTNVRFRFALGVRLGNESDKSEGFAFDNFSIFNRNRLTILETFSSSISEESRDANDEVRESLVAAGLENEVIWVNYFTDLSDDTAQRDLIAEMNNSDPEARLAFYGISNVPSAALSGIVRTPRAQSIGGLGFNSNDLQQSILADTQFDVIVNAEEDRPAGLVNISVDITAKPENESSFSSTSETAVRVFVLQDEVSAEFIDNVSGPYTFSNRLIEILPAADGQVIQGELTEGQVIVDQTLQWRIKDLFGEEGTEVALTVVAFVQDEINRDVYQVGISRLTVQVPETVTGIITDLNLESTYDVYPNPGDKQFTISMEQPIREDLSWSLSDYSGKEIKNGQLQKGATHTIINIEELASGVYMLKLFNAISTWQSRRVMVLRR
ncbi:MAG: Ig-like domain-containing protein [Bacteroidota bacterium]